MRARGAFLLVVAAIAAGVLAPDARAGSGRVSEVVLSGPIDPVSAQFVDDQIDAAVRRGDAAVVLRIDTPGGLETSMDSIVKHELAARIPVIAYVSPDGSRAASAGVFVMMASDVAAMAPQTNLGSSTPISSTGSNIDSDLRRKVVNDAVAKIRALASEHGRNADWAEEAVRTAANVPAREALAKHVVEFVAPTLADALRQADGFRTRPKGLTVHAAGLPVRTIEMPLQLQILQVLINPNIVFVLFIGGLGLIAFEIFHPGVIVPGLAGVVMVVLALFSFSVLPFTWTGLILTLAGLGMLLAEAHVGHGALAAAGVVSLTIGSLLLFDTGGTPLAISLPLVLVVSLTMGAFFAFVISRTVRARRQPVATGDAALVGQLGVAREPLAPGGLVYVGGELWQAVVPLGARVEAGEEIIVEGREGLVLEVVPAGAGGRDSS